MTRRRPRDGYTAADLLVALGLAGAAVLVVLMAMPRNRERARLTACQRNLGQIGLALALYDRMEGELPSIGGLEAIEPAAGMAGASAGPGPLRSLLDAFGLDSFRDLSPASPPPRPAGPVPGEVPVPGFVCASDPAATDGRFRAPVSYRAATGSDTRGRDGVFAPGGSIGIEQAERGDGASFTAAFSERQVGDGREEAGHGGNFASLPGPLPTGGCPEGEDGRQSWRWHGDAGSSWVRSGYRSTLYNHAAPPGSPVSCVADDGLTASMAASSGHAQGVNLLMLDGSVKLVTPTIAPPVWKEFASLSAPPTSR